MDLTTKTVEELKALAYDQIAQKELAERNLQILNQEISKRLQVVPEPDKKKQHA